MCLSPKISALKKPLKRLAEPEVCYRKNVGYNYALPVNVTLNLSASACSMACSELIMGS